MNILEEPPIKAIDDTSFAHHPERRSQKLGREHHSRVPVVLGLVVALVILLISAGATFFFLTKPSDGELLLRRGEHELSGGQFAFAVKSLEQASTLRPHDSRVFLSLARAYIGVDQIDNAWQAISQAQQLGAGVLANSDLASELANYYRQHSQYQRAIELLRPLANANIAGKKSELADLDALWGDEALRDDKLEQALKCWEEVKLLQEGTRYAEADARLATIYQKLVNKMLVKGDDEGALNYLNRLNIIGENAANLSKAAEIYERQNKLELAIENLRRALKLNSSNPSISAKLASLLTSRGKELLDDGDTNGGYGYIQQAQALDSKIVLPDMVLRNTSVSMDGATHHPKLTGEVWNSGTNPINELTLKVDLINSATKQVLWQQSYKLIDEFVSPLMMQSFKSFEITAAVPVKSNGTQAFQTYLNGQFYKSYAIGQAPTGSPPSEQPAPAAKDTHPNTQEKSSSEQTSATTPSPPTAPSLIPAVSPPQPAPARGQRSSMPDTTPQSTTPEDQTLKDLDL